jgi:hypothetical protein
MFHQFIYCIVVTIIIQSKEMDWSYVQCFVYDIHRNPNTSRSLPERNESCESKRWINSVGSKKRLARLDASVFAQVRPWLAVAEQDLSLAASGQASSSCGEVVEGRTLSERPAW